MASYAVKLGFAVGAVPTVSMSLAALLFTRLEIGNLIEACFQNFAGGLILAAVAAELFPLVLEGVRARDTYIGVTVGFAVGLFLVFGLESVIDAIAGGDEEDEKASEHGAEVAKGHDGYVKTKVEGDFSVVEQETRKKSPSGAEWDESHIEQSAVALKLPQHRQHILEHLTEMLDAIKLMEERCSKLSNPELSRQDMEMISEEIDECTHALQYKVDHTRRLLQGSESMLHGDHSAPFVLSEEKLIAMKHRLGLLEASMKHVIEHVNEAEYDMNAVKEIHEHMEDMDHVIESFHDHVASATSRWVRRHRMLPDTSIGDSIPSSLVIPVTMDCFVDGFLIGVACALSSKAGIVLGCANCLEMSFLGMAYSIRITKCTGSSAVLRNFALYGPPLLMFLASGFGAFVAQAARHVPAVFVSFVGFGIVALLALACGELFIEARESQGEDAIWWVQACLFAGVYLVLMLDNVI